MTKLVTSISSCIVLQLLAINYVAAEESCTTVYQYATRDIDIQTKINQQFDYTFDNYCNKDRSKQTFTMTDSIGLIFDDLPFDFKSSKGATNDRVTEFCRAYSSQRYVNNRYFHYKNDVQVAALKAFNECVGLQTEGIQISYTPNGMLGGSINGTFKNRTTALVINAVSYDKKLVTCKLSSANSRAATIVDDSKPVDVSKNFTVVCTRSPQKDSGQEYYPSTDVRLDTNSGGYSVHFEGDGLNGFYGANEAKAKYDQAQKDLQQSKRDIAELQGRLANASAVVHIFSTGQDQPVPCERASAAGVNAYAKSVCGSKVVSLTDFGSSSGGICGYHHFALACIDTGE